MKRFGATKNTNWLSESSISGNGLANTNWLSESSIGGLPVSSIVGRMPNNGIINVNGLGESSISGNGLGESRLNGINTRINNKPTNGIFMQQQVRGISIKKTRMQQEQLLNMPFKQSVKQEPRPDPILVLLKNAIETHNSSYLELKFDQFKLILNLLSLNQLIQMLDLLSSRPLNRILITNMELICKQIIERNHNDAEIFIPVLNGYYEFQDGKSIENIVKYCVSKQLNLTENMMLLILRHYSKNGPLSSAERLLEFYTRLNEPSPELYNLLIDCCGNTNVPWESWRIIKVMESRGISTSHYNLKRVLQAFSKNGNIKGMEYTLDIIKQKKIKLSNQYLNTLMNGYKQSGQFSKGTILLTLSIGIICRNEKVGNK